MLRVSSLVELYTLIPFLNECNQSMTAAKDFMATVWILSRPLWILDYSRLIGLFLFTAETCTKNI